MEGYIGGFTHCGAGTMFIKDDVDNFLRQKPFQPFRITTTIGETFVVPHHEMMITSNNFVAVGLPEAGRLPEPEKEPSVDTIITLSLLHIVKIEPIKDGA